MQVFSNPHPQRLPRRPCLSVVLGFQGVSETAGRLGPLFLTSLYRDSGSLPLAPTGRLPAYVAVADRCSTRRTSGCLVARAAVDNHGCVERRNELRVACTALLPA